MSDKYYITQSIVEVIDGRLTGREVVLTRADAKVDKEGARKSVNEDETMGKGKKLKKYRNY